MLHVGGPFAAADRYNGMAELDEARDKKASDVSGASDNGNPHSLKPLVYWRLKSLLSFETIPGSCGFEFVSTVRGGFSLLDDLELLGRGRSAPPDPPD